VIIVRNPQKRQAVTNQVNWGHGVLYHRPREGNQEPILDHPSNIHSQRRGLSHQQENSKVQRKSASRIGPENSEIQMQAGVVPQRRVLHDNPRHGQEHQTTGSNIVKGGNRVQRNSLGIKQNLNQNQPSGFKRNSQKLQRDAPGIEFGFSVSSNCDSKRN